LSCFFLFDFTFYFYYAARAMAMMIIMIPQEYSQKIPGSGKNKPR
jgi:hypothetical protein